MKRVSLFFIFLFFFIFSVFSNELSDNINRFSFKFISAINKDEGNIFVSPFSLWYVYSLLYNSTGGKTKQEFEKTFLYDNLYKLNQFNYELYNYLNSNGFNLSNSLWVDNKLYIRHKFLNIAKKVYFSDIFNINFSNKKAAVDKINHWVYLKTNGRISNFLKDINIKSNTSLFILNTVYFKKDWETKFLQDKTSKRPFYIKNNRYVYCDLMYQENYFKYLDVKNKEFKVIEIPYQDDRFSLIVFLPYLNKSLNIFSSFSFDDFIYYVNKLENSNYKKVRLYIPKFNFIRSYHVNDILKSLGLKSAYSPIYANFYKLTKNYKLYIQDTLQTSYIKFNEEGTEATSVSSIKMGITAARPDLNKDYVEFRANHPFMFFIIDNKYNIIYFYGRLKNPKK